MARVEIRPSGTHHYAVVVDDVWTGSRWKKRMLKSFGNSSNPQNVRNAHQFCAVYNAATELQKQDLLTRELLIKIAKGIAWTGGVALLLALLFSEE